MKSPLGLNADLPVMDLLKEAVSLLMLKKQQVARMFVPAMLILALVDSLSSELVDKGSAQLIFIVVSVVLGVLFATAAHRFTLLPEEQWHRNAIHGWGRDEFRYLLRAIIIGLAAAVVFFIIMLVCMAIVGPELAWMGAVVACLPALYIWARLSVTLPEVALGQKSDISRAWALSEGNGSRLVLIVIVLPVMMMLPVFASYAAENWMLNYVAAFGGYITSLISLVMLSVSYRFLTEFYDKPAETSGSEVSSADESPSPDNNGFDA